VVDFIDKKKALERYFPRPFYQLKSGQGISILLETTGDEMNQASDDVKEYRKQFLLATAAGKYLQVHGVNVDLFRLRGYNMSDAKYRELIKIVTNTQKNIEYIFERLIKLFFGDSAFDSGLVDIYSYRKNEIVLEIKSNALIIASSRSLYGTTYLHQENTGHFDGFGALTWSTTLAAPALAGSLSVALSDTTNVPISGLITLSPTEIKGFSRVGSILTFFSPTKNDYAAGAAVEGPQDPDDYPSGYLYYPQKKSEILGSYAAGVSSFDLGSTYENVPEIGIMYIGDPEGATFETKGFSRVGSTVTLEGVTVYPHSSGESVSIPNMTRKTMTTLGQNIAAGGSFAELTVANSADFPLDYQAAAKLNVSFGNAEDIPFRSRKFGDNTKIVIDPDYVFKEDHAVGEKVQLMARKTTPNVDGTDWAFFLNDTDSLRNQFFNLLRRVKVTGVRITFSII